MLEVVSGAVIGFAVFLTALRLRSPLVLAATFLFLLAPFRFDSDDFWASFVLFFAWCCALTVAIIAVKVKDVSLDNFHLRTTRKFGPYSFLVMGFILALFLMLWLRNLGVTSFEGHHQRETSSYSNILNVLFRSLTAYSVIVLAFWNNKLPKGHFILAIMIMLATIIGAYLINKRGMAFWPILTIIIVRLCTITDMKRLVRWAAVSALALLGAGVLMVEMTSQRGGGTDWDAAMANLEKTLAGEKGNGPSPNMDLAVINYVEDYGEFLDPLQISSGFWGLIPRALWQEKPSVGVGPIVGAYVYGTGGGEIGKGAGTPVSVPAQMEATFGRNYYYVGVFLVGAFFYFFAIAAKYWPVLIYYVITATPWLMSSDIGRTQIALTVGIVVVFCLFRACGVSLVYRTKPLNRVKYQRRSDPLARGLVVGNVRDSANPLVMRSDR